MPDETPVMDEDDFTHAVLVEGVSLLEEENDHDHPHAEGEASVLKTTAGVWVVGKIKKVCGKCEVCLCVKASDTTGKTSE